jgi:hypothetical protein
VNSNTLQQFRHDVYGCFLRAKDVMKVNRLFLNLGETNVLKKWTCPALMESRKQGEYIRRHENGATPDRGSCTGWWTVTCIGPCLA